MKFLSRIEKSFSFWFLLLISVIFTILRFPSLYEPNWYGDEGVYQAIGVLINNGASLYSGAWDNKPPLLLVLYAVLNSDQFIIRATSLIFGLISVWIFYFLSRKLFSKDKYSSVLSTTIYTLIFGSILIEGNIANAENFMLLPILLGAYLVITGESFKKVWHFKTYLFAGFLISIAFLTKIVAVFDFMAFTFFLLIDPEKNLKEKIYKKTLPFIIGFSLPVIFVMGYFLATNNFKDFMDAFLFSNVGYVGKENEFIIPQGLLFIKSTLLMTFLLFIFWKRNKINRNVMFISVWFAFALFNAFFSQRPYTHYLIMLLPSFSLMIGAIIYYKKERFLLFIFLILGTIAVHHSFILEDEFTKYYSNFIKFTLNKKTLTEYQVYFDKITPLDYEVANYINSNTNDNESVLIWGNNAQVYKLTNKTPLFRYTVAYHVSFFPTGLSDMQNAITTKKPKLIITMPNVPDFPLPLTGYNEKIDIHGAKVYEKVL